MSRGIQVSGLKSAQSALDKAMSEVLVETEEVVTVILMGISANTMPYVPVDTSTLINSEMRRVRKTPKGITGTISYGADNSVNPSGTPVQEYAVHVHEGPQKNWQKPGASNQFLRKGAEDFIRDDLTSVLARYQP